MVTIPWRRILDLFRDNWLRKPNEFNGDLEITDHDDLEKISNSFVDKCPQRLGEFNKDVEISLWTFYYRYRDFFFKTLEI